MVVAFRRSLSLSLPNPSSPKLRFHVRSTSLPCRSHPLTSHVENEIRALRAWQCGADPDLSSGLMRLELLLLALDDLLHSHDAIQHCAAAVWTERLLADFLSLADAHGTLRAAVVELKQHQAAAQVAVRARDDSLLASCLRSQKRVERELAKAAASLHDVGRSPAPPASEGELAGVVRVAISAVAAALVAVLLGVAAASSSAVAQRGYWVVGALRRLPSSPRMRAVKEEGEGRRRALERMEAVEERLGGLESGSEMVFRCLINTRVSLLNILTPI